MSRKTGTIKKWMDDKNFGFIKPKDGSKDLFVHANDINIPKARLRVGTQVEFDVIKGRRGPAAGNVTLPGEAKVIPPKGYRFYNPYNFVRILPQRKPADDAPKDVKLLTFAPPPTHDRYSGLSGTISCELTTATPLFVSDSEGVTQAKGDNGKPHNSHRFFTVKGKKAIPATTLRGALRNVYEIITNSPFSNLGGEQLSYRLESDEVRKLVPGRIEKDENGAFRLMLLPGSAPFSPSSVQKKLYASPARFYKPLNPPRQHRDNPPRPLPEALNFKHGQECYAILADTNLWWRAKALFADEESARHALPQFQRNSRDATLRVQRGWMCITNQNADNKSNERFLYRDESKHRNTPEFVMLSSENRKDYEALISDYQSRHAEDVRKRKTPAEVENDEIAYSRHILRPEERKLKGGELVFARLGGTTHQPVIKYIAPVSWPRVAYKTAIRDLLPRHLRPQFESLEALSPAARLFGWVHGEEEGAYAGRIRLSNALLVQSGDAVGKKTLSILGSPKPTTTRFYLKSADGNVRAGRSDVEVGYDGRDPHGRPNSLRGRKAYRHHEPDPKHAYRSERSDQNRTIEEAEGKGAKFTFTISFANLAEVELGALLWALTLDGRAYHKIGYAKPLGFGSVEIRPKSVTLHNFAQRYQSLMQSGNTPLSQAQQDGLVLAFKRATVSFYLPSYVDDFVRMAKNDGTNAIWHERFEALPNITDLLVLQNKIAPQLPVHYPFSSDPSSKGQFEWFVGNKRSSGPRVELGLTHEDRGLPLINKQGKTH